MAKYNTKIDELEKKKVDKKGMGGLEDIK